jgi:hypothetical protein
LEGNPPTRGRRCGLEGRVAGTRWAWGRNWYFN